MTRETRSRYERRVGRTCPTRTHSSKREGAFQVDSDRKCACSDESIDCRVMESMRARNFGSATGMRGVIPMACVKPPQIMQSCLAGSLRNRPVDTLSPLHRQAGCRWVMLDILTPHSAADGGDCRSVPPRTEMAITAGSGSCAPVGFLFCGACRIFLGGGLLGSRLAVCGLFLLTGRLAAT